MRLKMAYDKATKLWVRAETDMIAAEMKEKKARPGLLQRVKVKREIYDPHGNVIGQAVVDEVGNSHHEYADHQDAVARPATVSVRKSLEERGPLPFVPQDYSHFPAYLAEALHMLDRTRYQAINNPGDLQSQQAFRAAKRHAGDMQLRYQAETKGP